MYVVMHSYWSVASFIQGIQVWILVCKLAVLIEWLNNSRYCRDFPLKEVATASNCRLQQTSPHLVRWYKILWLLNNASIDIFHWSLIVFGNVDSEICHAVAKGYKRQGDSLLTFMPSIWWVPAFGLTWVLAIHIDCLWLSIY